MFERRNWQDEVRSPSNAFSVTDNTDGTKTIQRAGSLIQEGTNENANNFNAMDDGILDAQVAEQIMLQNYLQKRREYEERIGTLEDDCTVESGEVTLTNSSKYPFNNSIKTISLAKTRDTINYYVEVSLVEYSGGLPGDIDVSGKALNGFKIEFNGSAKTVKVKYQVKGGILS